MCSTFGSVAPFTICHHQLSDTLPVAERLLPSSAREEKATTHVGEVDVSLIVYLTGNLCLTSKISTYKLDKVVTFPIFIQEMQSSNLGRDID